MVILDTLTSHGPHKWYASVLWYQQGFYIDFLRLEKIGCKASRNKYNFKLA